jgi:hypothetical protein
MPDLTLTVVAPFSSAVVASSHDDLVNYRA